MLAVALPGLQKSDLAWTDCSAAHPKHWLSACHVAGLTCCHREVIAARPRNSAGLAHAVLPSRACNKRSLHEQSMKPVCVLASLLEMCSPWSLCTLVLCTCKSEDMNLCTMQFLTSVLTRSAQSLPFRDLDQ